VPAKLARWCRGADNQEVGSEAATLERVRNSSLVESRRADNVPGIKRATDAMDVVAVRRLRGRGASHPAVKPERKHGWSGCECGCRYE